MQPISRSNLSRIACLKHKKYRDEEQAYLISGLFAVKTALESTDIHVTDILLRQDRLDWLQTIPINAGKMRRATVHQLSAPQFQKISDEKNPQGIALVARKPSLPVDPIVIDDPLVIYLDQINDPGNLGTIIRTSAWFGVRTLLLSPRSADPFQPKVVRSSAGLISHMRCLEEFSPLHLNQLITAGDYRIIGASEKAEQRIDHFDFKSSQKYCLVFGSEARGISPELQRLIQQPLAIPRYGVGQSLNLAVSVALFLYQRSQNKSA